MESRIPSSVLSVQCRWTSRFKWDPTNFSAGLLTVNQYGKQGYCNPLCAALKHPDFQKPQQAVAGVPLCCCSLLVQSHPRATRPRRNSPLHSYLWFWHISMFSALYTVEVGESSKNPFIYASSLCHLHLLMALALLMLQVLLSWHSNLVRLGEERIHWYL